MRGRGIFVAAAMAAASCLSVTAAPVMAQAVLPAEQRRLSRAERRHQATRPNAAPINRRSKNPPQRRKLRANRLIVSRRVRRRHRRRR